MQILFGLLAAQFIIPSLSYFFTPELALDQAMTIGRILGGAAYPVEGERGQMFRVLAAGNVFTLVFLCLQMLRDIRRYPTLMPIFVVQGYLGLLVIWRMLCTAGGKRITSVLSNVEGTLACTRSC